jgi:predicted PurR-regulated permease PerM
MTWFHRDTARVLVTVLAFAAVGAFIYAARETLIAFIFAIFFAYLLAPAVEYLQKRRLSRHSRNIAILETYVVLLLALSLVGMFAGPKLVSEGRKLMQAAPGYVDKLASGELVSQVGTKRGWTLETQTRVQQFLEAHRGTILDWVNSFAGCVSGLAGHVLWLLLIPIFAIFFLKDGRRMCETVIDAVDRRSQRQFLRGVVADLDEMLAGYIRAQLLLAALSIVVYTVVLSLMRVPYAVALGVSGGIMEFIPVLGPLVAALAIVGVAFLASYPHVLMVAIFLGAWRLAQDYYNSPRIMGTSLELHPLAAIFAILVGGEIGGVIGVYLSVPIMATLRILWRRYQRYSATAVLASGGPSALSDAA